MRELHHLTLNNGHTRRSPRAEVGDGILALLAPLVAAGGGRLPTPADGYRLTVVRAEGEEGAATFTVQRVADNLPLVTCFVVWDRRQDARYWALAGGAIGQLRDQFPPGALPAKMPPRPASVPWLAVLIWPTLALDPVAAGWIADLERCVAWTLIEGGTP